MVHALRRSGIDAPFPIQSATIPDVLAGRDVLGRGATGSGKTLAFGLPMLVRLKGGASKRNRPRGLVLAPTRELAIPDPQGTRRRRYRDRFACGKCGRGAFRSSVRPTSLPAASIC